MDLLEIARNIRAEARKLMSGPDRVKQFGGQLSAISDRIERYKKANEYPITAETPKQVRGGDPQFEPRQLP